MTNEKTRPPRWASGLLVAVLLLAGCGSQPSATPLVIRGSASGDTAPFTLARGDYSVSWLAGEGCPAALWLWRAQPYPTAVRAFVGAITEGQEPSGIVRLSSLDGAYAIWSKNECPWQVAFTKQ